MKRKWEESQSDGECIELLIGKKLCDGTVDVNDHMF